MALLNIVETKSCLAGERVICVGNGPSLRDMDFNLVKRFKSIGLNRISQIYGDKDWQPDYFVCSTINVQQTDWNVDIQKTIDLGIPTLIGSELVKYVSDTDHARIYPVRTYAGHSIGVEGSDYLWSDDLSKQVSKMGSSILVSAQWAAYMGASEIIFIGCDLGFDRSFLQRVAYRLGLVRLGNRLDKSHFSSNYGTPGGSGEFFNENMSRAHHVIRKNTARLGIDCWNSTIGGHLDVYPRKSLEALSMENSRVEIQVNEP